MKKVLVSFLILSFFYIGSALAADGVPVSGRVVSVVDGAPVNGSGYFKAALCDETGQLFYTNDGLGSSCQEPQGHFTVDDIVNGYYGFTLGDAGLDGDSVAIDDAVLLEVAGLFLHIWFSEDPAEEFESIGVLELVSVPSALNSDFLGGFAAEDFLRADAVISLSGLSGSLPASQVDGFSEDARTLTLGSSVDASNVAIQANISSALTQPAIRYEASLGEWQISNDGSSYSAISTFDSLDADSVGATEISADAVGASEIAVDAVTADEIAAGAVNSSELADGAVGSSELAVSGVVPGAYSFATVTVDEDGRVTAAATGAELGDISAVGDVAGGAAFTATPGADGATLYFEGATADDNEVALTSDDAVGDVILTLPAITGTLISTSDLGSVSSLMVADGALSNADVSASAGVAFSKLANVSPGQLLLGDAAGVVSATTLSGDATIASDGTLTLSDGSVDGGDLSIGGATLGDLLYFDGSSWARLAPGSSGQALVSAGSGATPIWTSITSSAMPHEVLSRRVGYAHPITTAATTFTAVGMSAPASVSGTATAQPAATGATRMYIRYASTAVLNALAGLGGGPFTQTRPLYRPKYSAVILTDSNIASRRIYAGLAESSLQSVVANTSGTTASAVDYVAVGYDTAATGNTTDWLCCSGDGTNSSCVTTGVAVVASTEYTLTADWTTAGSLVCTVNGTSVTKSTNLSTNAVNLGIYNTLTSLSAAAKNHFIAKQALEQN